MEHKEYKRICDSSDIAVLFVHGIVGTPNHFLELVSLVPNTISVYNLLLDGHGKGVKDFSATSMKKWEDQVEAAVGELSQHHSRILIVAHSMGTLLAIEQAVKNPVVSNLFLLAVPMKVSLKSKVFVHAAKVYFDKIDPNDLEALAAKKCYGIGPDKNPLHYLAWIPRFVELFGKIRQTRKILGLLSTTCTVYQSGKDELVSGRSIDCLKENPRISLKELNHSGHFYYEESDWDYLLSEFRAFVDSEYVDHLSNT